MPEDVPADPQPTDASHPLDLTSLHIARATKGEPASRAWIVERFTPVLLAQARYRLRGPLAQTCDAFDLVQDVWAITLPRLPDLRSRDGRWTPVVLKFLSTTLLRQINHLLRKQIANRARGAPTPAGDEQPRIAAVPADVTGVVTRLDRNAAADALHRALDALPDDEREAVLLRGIEQLSNREVARTLGVADHVVTRRYQRALARLREELPDSVFCEID